MPTLRLIACSLAMAVPSLARAQGAPLDSASVDRFASAFIASLTGHDSVPRGAMVFVRGDRIAYARGFGTTPAGRPIDPERTIFRAASNSKLVAATAAIQLAERGTWRLGDDVNRWLPPEARLASAFPAPVTVANLLTHTSGFEDSFAGGVTPAGMRSSLATYFARHRPYRAVAPGLEVSYSNAGIALAGYLVERASGEPFGRYADAHIFAPLGMRRSSFDQPPPREWLDDLASGVPRGNRDVYFNPYPAASLVMTPTDMGRFIAAHLGGGAAYGGRILSSAWSDSMHASHWRAQPSVPAVAYGFFEGEMNGRRTLFHTGDSGDHSLVLLFPDDGVGLFLVYTGSDDQASIRERFARAFADRFLPVVAPGGVSSPSTAQFGSLRELEGTFRGAQHARSSYEKVKAMFLQARVRDGGDQTLRVAAPGGGPEVRLTRVAALVFRGDSGEMVAFRRGADGHVTGFTLSGSVWDPSSWDRIPWIENGSLHFALLASAVAVLLVRLLIFPLAALARRLRGAASRALSVGERRWWRWSALASALVLAAPVAALATAFLSFTHPVVAVPRAMRVLQALLVVGVVCGVALAPAAIVAWRRRWWTTPRRVIVTLEALAFVAAAPVLGYYQLL
ncbi:MAG: serine hydrolase domain-containing protein [Gemmatimonadaceae bacterium]